MIHLHSFHPYIDLTFLYHATHVTLFLSLYAVTMSKLHPDYESIQGSQDTAPARPKATSDGREEDVC